VTVDLKTVALVILGVAAFVFLLLIAFVVYIVVRYRPSIMGILGLLAGTAWVASPVDPLPEALLGPLGLTDDLAVIAAMGWYALQLARRMPRPDARRVGERPFDS
jgi:uncharacterized membrane protein YkvA (DUF1232 family)